MTDTYDHEFTWAWEGTEIKATGTFDKWQSTLTLIKGPDGIYAATAPLKRGKKIQYKYVVDGIWKHNEAEPFEKDQSGNVNNVLTVPDEGQAVPRVISATPAIVEEEVPAVEEPVVVVAPVVVETPKVVEAVPVVAEEVATPAVVEEVVAPVVEEPKAEEAKVEEPTPVVEVASPAPVVEEEKVVEPIVVEEVKPVAVVEPVVEAAVEPEPTPVVEPVVEAAVEPEPTPVVVEEPIVEATPVVEEAVVEPTPVVEETPAPVVVASPAPVVEEEKKDDSEIEKVAAIAAGLAAAALAAAALAASKVHEAAAAVLEKVPVPEVLQSTPTPIAAAAAAVVEPVEEDSFGASTMAALGLNQASPVLPTQILNEPEANTVAAVTVAEESIPATLVDTPILAALPPVVEAPALLVPSEPVAAEAISPTATIAPPTPVKEAPATPEKKSALENKKTQASLGNGPSDASPAVTRSKKSLFGKLKNAFSSPKKQPSA